MPESQIKPCAICPNRPFWGAILMTAMHQTYRAPDCQRALGDPEFPEGTPDYGHAIIYVSSTCLREARPETPAIG